MNCAYAVDLRAVGVRYSHLLMMLLTANHAGAQAHIQATEFTLEESRSYPQQVMRANIHLSEAFGETQMKSSNSNAGGVIHRLLQWTTRGAHVELTLRNGKKISRFRVHEVIAPKGLEVMSNPGEARARGIVWPDHGTHRDEYIQVRDIESVRDEQLAPYVGSEEFFQRHPLPASWVRLARCPAGPKR